MSANTTQVNFSRLQALLHTSLAVSLVFAGTYNNQYMVLDMKKVELKKAIRDGALWVVEQIPGYD